MINLSVLFLPLLFCVIGEQSNRKERQFHGSPFCIRETENLMPEGKSMVDIYLIATSWDN
jgi:hypothetical protein